MAEPLEIDLVFAPNGQEAQALLAQLNDGADELTRTVADAFQVATGIGSQLSSGFDASGLQSAADAVDRLANADLSAVQDGAAALANAASPAEDIASSLTEAAAASSGIGADTAGLAESVDLVEQLNSGIADAVDASAEIGNVAIDPAPAEQLALVLGEAADAASAAADAAASVGDGLQLSLFSDAVADVDALTAGLDSAAASAEAVQIAAEGVAAGMSDARSAVDELASGAADTGDQLALFGADIGGLSGQQDGLNEGLGEQNRLLLDSAFLADSLGEAFAGFQSTLTQGLGSAGGAVDALIEKLGGLKSLATAENLLGGGLAVGEVALTRLGQRFDVLSNQIVQATGLTGDALSEANQQFGEVLRSSDESAAGLASTFGVLRRDLGLTGDSLVQLTTQTADFLSATGGSVSDVRSLTQVVHQFGLDAGQTAEFQDQLVAVQDRYGGSVSNLLGTIRTAGPILQTLGFDAGQIAGLSGQLDQAGISVGRLAPRLASFAQKASETGQDAGEAFRGLVDQIATADETVGNAKAFEVFGARIGPQFATAVRQGTINLEELDNVLATSSGAAKRKADELDDLGSVFSQMKNQILGTLGPIGKELSDNLGGALARTEPLLQAILDLVAAVSPAFGTLGRVLGLVTEGIAPLVPILETVAGVIDSIPDPVLQMAAAFVLFKKATPDGLGGSILSLSKQLVGFVKSIPAAIQGLGSFGAAAGKAGDGLAAGGKGIAGAAGGFASANVAALAVTATFAAVTGIMQYQAAQSQHLKDAIDALNKTLGATSIESDKAGAALDKALSKGDEGGLISSGDLDRLAAINLSVSQYRKLVQDLAADPKADIGQAIRRQAVESAGGIRSLIENANDFGRRREALNFLNANGVEGERELADAYERTGRILGANVRPVENLTDSAQELVKAERERAKSQIAQLENSGKIQQSDIDEAVAALGLKNQKEDEVAVRDKLVTKINVQAAADAGLTGITEDQANARAALISGLEEAGNTQEQINAKTKQAIDLQTELGALLVGGNVIDTQEAANAATQAGVSSADDLAAAVAKVQAAYAAVSGPTAAQTAAQAALSQAISDGVPPAEALHDVQLRTGVDIDVLKDGYLALRSAVDAVRGPTEQQVAAQQLLAKALAEGIEPGEALLDVQRQTGAPVDEVAAALTRLQAAYQKATGPTQAQTDAQRLLLDALTAGIDPALAWEEISHRTGLTAEELAGTYNQLADKLRTLNAVAEPTAEEMDAVARAFADGTITGNEYQAVIDAAGGSTAAADEAIKSYKSGVEQTTQALDNLVPSLGSVVSKLQDAEQITFAAGPDASGQLSAISDAAKARRDALGAEREDLENQKALRSEAADAEITAQKNAIQEQKRLAEDAAKARGEAFDSTAFDVQIQALKAHVDTDDLDAQIADIETRQKTVDAQLARAQAALEVFDQEEQAIRARGSLRDTDLASQQAHLAATRDAAKAQADAQGRIFDTGPLDAQIAAIQAQRDKIAAETNQSIVDAETASERVQGAVEKAQGGVLDFSAVLDTFDAQNKAKAEQAKTVAELRAQGLDATVQALFDPDAGLSEADRAAFLTSIATASPEERTAIERHAEESIKLIDEKNAAIKAAGDIFADANPEMVDHAKTRGQELAKGLTDGFVAQLDESKINEIVDLVIKTGVNPSDARKFVEDQVAAARRASQPGASPAGSLASVGVSTDQIVAIEDQFGLSGATSGKAFLDEAQAAMKEGLDPDAAAAMLAPVQDKIPQEGVAGGGNFRGQVQEAIRTTPIDPDAAAALMGSVQAQMPAEGAAGGTVYATNVRPGIDANPIPIDEAFKVAAAAVGNVSTAMGTEGFHGGYNYGGGISAGIVAYTTSGAAFNDAFVLGEQVATGGNAGLGNHSPSVKGRRSGEQWVEGITLGIEASTHKATAAAEKMAFQVAATTIPVLDVPRLPDIASQVTAAQVPPPAAQPALVGAGVGAGAAGGGDTTININATVTGTTNANADEVAEAMSRKIGWLGITGRAEL